MWHSVVIGADQDDTVYVNANKIDEPIKYGARDSLYMDMKNNVVHLYGEAFVDNGEVRMNAGYIMIDLKKNEVMAKYRYSEDSTKVEYPLFSDGQEEIKASTIRYNFNSEKAYIEEVAIQQDENFMYMGVAKRHSNEEIHFKHGRFTTCNLAEPHYHFQLSKAVMIPEKRIVSGPMNLWIKGVPTPLGLPFSIIPQMEEKTSGFLFPEIIPVSQYGFGLQNLGYYIPINDRLQTTFYGTLYSRGSWGLSNETEYAKIYKHRGKLNLGFLQFRSGFPTNVNRNKVTVGWVHRMEQNANPYWNFSSNVNFISDNNSQNNLDPINPTYFNNSFSSDINLNRLFPGKPVSMGAKISLRQNSQTQNISLASPVFNVNVSRFFPLERFVRGTKGMKGLISRLGVTYSFEGQNKTLFADSLIRESRYDLIGDQFQNGMDQRITIQTTGGLFKNTLKLTPSISYGNKINFQQTRKSYDASLNSTINDTLSQFGMAHDLNFSFKLTSAVYSYYKFIGKRTPLLRHVLTPSFGFTYIPNLNRNITDSVGIDKALVTYSPFERSLYSVGSTGDQALLTFGFNNTFELKRKSDKDTVDGFKRTRIIELLSINGNYDFLKDSMNLSDLRLNLRINPVHWFNVVTTSSFSPYDWVDSTGKTLGNYALDNNRLGRFTSTNVASTITLTSKSSKEKLNELSEAMQKNWNADFEYYALHPEHALVFDIPWKVSLSHVYTINVNTAKSALLNTDYIQIQTLAINGDVSITKRWKVATNTNFDLNDFRVTNARFTLTRDMHCWALAFHWTPVGLNKSFLLSIRSTASLFKDAKVDFRKPPAFL